MAYGVTVTKSPVFTPSLSLSMITFCNKPTTLLSPSPSSPCKSPFTFRLSKQQYASGFNRSCIKLQKECFNMNSSNLIKRKRPMMKIDIPAVDLGLETIVEMKNETDRSDEVEVEGEGYSVYCKRGKRASMVDRYSANLDIGDSNQAFFGVFDGHGGARAAEYAAENLGKNIVDEVGKRGGRRD